MTTPMMQQYAAIKNNFPDKLLFFRMGDFYELFYEDAKIGSDIMGLTLTKRGSINGEPIPMAGVPYHSLDSYLVKVIKADYSVAICEQKANQANSSGPMEREVVRIITPGTLLDESLVDAKSSNYLAALSLKKPYALAWLDIGQGQIFVESFVDRARLLLKLEKLGVSELLVLKDKLSDKSASYIDSVVRKTVDAKKYRSGNLIELLQEHFCIQDFASLDLHYNSLLESSGMILNYCYITQKKNVGHIKKISRVQSSDFLAMDLVTCKHLELVDSDSGHSILGLLGKTKTPMGFRKLRQWLLEPILDRVKLKQRQQAILSCANVKNDLIKSLLRVGDLERVISRLISNVSKFKDLQRLLEALNELPNISSLLQNAITNDKNFDSTIINGFLKTFSTLKPLSAELNLLININAENDSELFKSSYNDELGKWRQIVLERDLVLKNLLETEKKDSGLSSLKIGYNKIIGAYFELSKGQVKSAPEHFILCQQLKNGSRYTTENLTLANNQINQAQAKIFDICQLIWSQTIEKIQGFVLNLQNTASALSEIDIYNNFAIAIDEMDLVMPNFVDDRQLQLLDCRHLAVEQQQSSFIPNSLNLNDNERMWLITGPNMGGKSTFMRQVAQALVLAHIGAPIPVSFANIGYIDRIFTRIGADDQIANNRSTFMVEMVEVANILHYATADSLVILDEIGRGTSTYDGLAIAWACSQYLLEKLSSYVLFSTHYYELTKLAKYHKALANKHVQALEEEDSLVYLYKLADGASDKSYGVHVARIAKLPPSVIYNAEKKLVEFSNKLSVVHTKSPPEQDILSAIASLDVDDISPKEALQLLTKWQIQLQNISLIKNET